MRDKDYDPIARDADGYPILLLQVTFAGEPGWYVLRPGDMVYPSKRDAARAAYTGADMEGKIGCHLVWESAAYDPNSKIATRLRDMWRPAPRRGHRARRVRRWFRW